MLYNNEKLNLQFFFLINFLLAIHLGDVTEVTLKH